MMNNEWCKAQRIFSASVLAVGILSTGVSAQAKSASTGAVASSPQTTVAVVRENAKEKRMKHLEKISAQERRVAFKHLGTSQ